MGRLRVLMLGWEYPPKITGGLGVACAALAGALRSKVQLELRLPGEDVAGAYASDGTGDLREQVRNFALGQAIEPGRFEVIHAHDWLTIPAAAEYSRRTGVPVVMHVHSLELDRSGERNAIFLVERAGMRIAGRAVAVSEYTAAICESGYGIPRSKIRVVPNGVGLAGIRPRDGASRKVLFLGRLTAQKSPGDFVRMASRVLRRVPEAEFVMAGRGELEEGMKALARELGLTDRIRFPGFLNRSQVMAELATAAVLCLPSRSEPFGLVALEAAAHGVPTVLTENSGVREVLPSARVVPVGDVAGMAEKVVELLGDDALREKLGRQARKEAEATSWDFAAERVVEVYREVFLSKA